MTTGLHRFRVDQVFDLTARGGLVACGTMLDGTPVGGLCFVDELTGAPIRVIAVDFPTPTTQRTGQHLLVVSREDAALVRPGRVWAGHVLPES
ncbi:hypothetical protein KBX37_10965 [Micromonospora sp. U56]|uniref:hypothetical protein n=1 Tax=Micromonospora sp. U56 TaxID=2824900 RepID=UPI001B3901F3|nr:hypothetical protein [Micromonospora sp. U56]MBQ0893608.1 hypothetical protein [Micromonospora sp. U56]